MNTLVVFACIYLAVKSLEGIYHLMKDLLTLKLNAKLNEVLKQDFKNFQESIFKSFRKGSQDTEEKVIN